MAERRMFAKTIIDSDAFIDMPLSTQALYFHLSMRADDDGFINNPRKIQRMVGASDDDLKMLVLKRFIIPFESGIVVIKHWKIHNYIRGDRKKDTVYPEEMSLLTEKENGAYTLISEEPIVTIEAPIVETARQKAYRESSLPYSFEYKIRHAFYGKICPVCGSEMRGIVDETGVESNNRRPTIQHNKPISKGGKHELGNISVICHQCNVSLQATETGSLNADEVIAEWDKICMSGVCPSTDRQVSDKCQHRLGKDSIGKYSIEESSATAVSSTDTTTPPRTNSTPTKHKKGEYKHVLLTDEEESKLIKEYGSDMTERAITHLDEYIEMKGYKAKSHYLAIRKWVIDAVKERMAKTNQGQCSSFDTDEFFEAALKRTMEKDRI